MDPALVQEMCGLIEHRGPDSRGAFVDEHVGLGIQRLAIIDLATGDQPIFNEDESVVVVLNGEIYNYRELRGDLIARGHRFRTETDTEVIVHLYEDHGEACVGHLRGMFSFALWDRRRERLFLARDRLGKKPLFYSDNGETLVFASEARAVVCDPEVPREANLEAIDAFLQYRFVPDPLSAFSALRKLPPAHTLTWSDGKAVTRRYWKLSYGPDDKPAEAADVHERIRAGLLEATRLRLRTDVPLGAFLSGGVDSSAVVAAMAAQASGRIKTFSIGFDESDFDETRHAREVAALFDTEHHEFRVQARAVELLPDLVWHYGEPFADPSAIPTFLLSQQTAGHVKVALSGDGGDENFAGYDRYRVNALMSRLDRTPNALPWAVEKALGRLGPKPRIGALRRARSLARYLKVPLPDRYAMTMGYVSRSEREALYTPEFRRAIGEPDGPGMIRDPWFASDATTVVERLLDVDLQTYLPGDLLVKVDIASMAHSLEVRSPLLDHVFMESMAALPAAAKLSGGASKRAFKDALRPWLPDHILDRRKMGFGVPISAWFRGPLRELPREVLLDPSSLRRGIFREDGVRALIDSHVSGVQDHGDTIWSLLQLELWHQTYIDSGKPERLTLSVG